MKQKNNNDAEVTMTNNRYTQTVRARGGGGRDGMDRNEMEKGSREVDPRERYI